MTLDHHDLFDLDGAALRARMAAGHPVDISALAGWTYHGISLALPDLVQRFVRKFGKTFHRDPGDDRVRGWNVRMRQDGLDAPWTPLRLSGRAVTYGHYQVAPAIAHPRFRHYPHAALIDYGAGGNRALDPTSQLRDYIVALSPGDPSALLGHMFVELGVARPATSSYFLLLRGTPLTDVVEPPRR